MEDNILKKVNLILDMDGVLIDSIEVQKRAFYGSYMSVIFQNSLNILEIL